MTDEALKPCPFCGGKSEFIRIDDDNDPCFGGVVVSCLGCGASSKVYFPLKEDVKPLLLEQWNRRAVLAEQAGTVRVPVELYRHRKTGGVYEVVCRDASLEWDAYGPFYTVYRNVDTGKVWVRLQADFDDGRFERIAAAPK